MVLANSPNQVGLCNRLIIWRAEHVLEVDFKSRYAIRCIARQSGIDSALKKRQTNFDSWRSAGVVSMLDRIEDVCIVSKTHIDRPDLVAANDRAGGDF